jgi:uncharacterized protein YaaW (UPF0174 family)
VDELREALELATDEELGLLTELLFRPKFNPLDYWNASKLDVLPQRSHREWVDALEERFRFLAADGMTVLQGRTDDLSYREVLLQVGHYLKLSLTLNKPQTTLYTDELEAEVFLHLIQQSWKRMPESDRQTLGRQLETAFETPEERSRTGRLGSGAWGSGAWGSGALGSGRLAPPLGWESLRLILEGGSALALSTVVQPLLLRQLARQLALQLARYQLAQAALKQGGGWLAGIQGRVGLSLLRRGVSSQVVRYGTVRSVLAVVGPALWVWFFADLGWRAIATNYARIIPAVFILAQIRLTRAEDFSTAISS